MAGGYDGSIRIKAFMDTNDASAQLMALDNRMVKTADKISALKSKMLTLRDTKMPTQEYENLQKELDAATKAVEKLVSQDSKLSDIDAKIKSLSQSSAEYAAKMKEVAGQRIPTQEYTNAQKQVDALEKKIVALYDRQERFLTNGGKEDSSTYKRMAYDAEALGIKLRQAEGDMKALVDSGKAFTFGTDTEQYKNLSAKYESVNAELEKQKSIYNEIENKQANALNKVDDIKDKISELVREGKAFTLGRDSQNYADLEQQLGYLESDYATLQQRQREIQERNRDTKSSFKRLAETAKNALKKIISSFGSLNKNVKSTNISLKSALKAILKYGLGIRSVYILINKFRAAVKTGFVNLAQYSESVNESLSMLKSSLTQMKNSFATAFAPIVTTVAPLLKMLIDMISQAATYVGMFIATLTGASTFTKAVAVQEDYAASLNKTAGAAKKAVGALAGFDDLDVLNKPNSGDNGAGTGQVPVTDMFEEVPIESKVKDLAEKFKEVMSKLFAPFKEAWDSSGQPVIDGWRYALGEIRQLMKNIGEDFLIMWNEKETVQMLENMLGIASDIETVAGNLARNLSDAWGKNQIGLQILENIRNIFAIIIEHIKNAADQTVIWSETLDFYPLLDSINRLLEAVAPLTDKIGEGLEWFWINILLPIAGWTIEDAIPAFLDMLSAALELLNVVLEAFEPLGTWLWENFLQPLGEWAGGMIISALEMITGLLKRLGDWISEHMEAIQQFISIVAPVAGIILLIANAGTVLSTAIGILSGVFAALTSPVALVVAGIAALAAGFVYLYEQSEEFRELIDGLGERIKVLWEEHLKPVFDNLFETFNLLGEAIIMMWENSIKPLLEWLVDILVPTITDVCGIVMQVIENAIIFVANIINGIIEVVNGVINILIGIVKGDWQRVWDGFAGVVRGVADVIKGIFNAIIGTVEGVANAVVAAANTMIRAINSISFTVPDWIPGVGGNSVGFNIPEIDKVQIPRLATGAVIRGGNPFMAVLGDQPAGVTNIETPLPTMVEAFKQAIAEMGGIGEPDKIPVNINIQFDSETFTRISVPNILSELAREGYDIDVLRGV